jgi:hypothetical protein
MDFSKPNIKFTPLEVEVDNITKALGIQSATQESDEIDETANKLMDHLAIIQDYNNRIDSINWLIDNAKKLAGNLVYSTDDQNIINAINDLGGTGNSVDLRLFEKAVDQVIEGYKQQALISLTGANN